MTGSGWFRLNAVTRWHSVLGPQSVNHINQFTSVTLFFNLKPGYTIGQATEFVEKRRQGDSASGRPRRSCRERR